MEAGDERRSKRNLRVVLRRRASFPASRALSASPWPALGPRSTRSCFVRARIAVRLLLFFLLPPPPPLSLCVATPTTCQQPCSLSLSRGREYNMTDGHSRTNTVGHTGQCADGWRNATRCCCSACASRRFPLALLRRHRSERNPPSAPPRFDSSPQSPYAPRLYVSLRSPTRRTCVAVCPLLSASLLFASLTVSPSSLLSSRAPKRNTSRTGGGKRDTCLALLSKRPIRTIGAATYRLLR